MIESKLSVIGIGIDSVEIARFNHWHTYSRKSLLKIFSTQEITYCTHISAKQAERFAVRFAAKEAFFKALSMSFANITFKPLVVFRNARIVKSINGHPELAINWSVLAKNSPFRVQTLSTKVSLTHTKSIATAIVIIEKK